MTFFSKYKDSAKSALRLAMPIVAGQLGQVLMGFFDTVQIGGLGHDYIAGSGFANNIYWMTNLIGVGVLFAVSTLVSEARGEKHDWKAIGVFRSGVKVSIILTVLLTIVLWFVMQNLDLFKQEKIVSDLAARFLGVMIFSTIFLFLFTAAKQLLDGLGRTTIGMVVTLGGLAMNVFLNWVLIYGHLGMPRMEIEGAALATSISRAVMTIALLVIIWRDKQVRELRAEYLAKAERAKSYIKQILAIGIPAGLQFFWEVAAFGAGQIMSGWFGTVNQAAFQIAIGLASIAFMIVTGLSTAGNIMTGYQYGSKSREGIRMAANTVFLITVALEIVFAIIFFAFHSVLPKLYTADVEVLPIASALLIFNGLFQISDGMQSVIAGALRGVQDVRMPSIIAFVSYWLVMVPLCYILSWKMKYGLTGIWIGFTVGLTVAAVSLYLRFLYKLKHLEFREV